MSRSGDSCQNTWCSARGSLEAPGPQHGLCLGLGLECALCAPGPLPTSTLACADGGGRAGHGGSVRNRSVALFPDPVVGGSVAPEGVWTCPSLNAVTCFLGADVW